MHNPPPIRERDKAFAIAGTRERVLIATSRYAALLWSAYLDVNVSTISVVYPFAEPCFAAQPGPRNETGKIRVLFAGRLSPEKGIYTLLETLHIDIIDQDPALTFTATTAGADKPQGKIIERLLGEHPGISVVATCKTPARMAALMAGHDIVVMPSNSQYWHETSSASSRSRPSTRGAGLSPPTMAACPRPTAGAWCSSGRTTPKRSPGVSVKPWTAGRSPWPRGRTPGQGSLLRSPWTRY